MPSEVAINRFINGRGFLWVVTAVSAMVALAATVVYMPEKIVVNGLFFRGIDSLSLDVRLLSVVNVVAIVVIGALLDRLVKTFAFVREHTMLAATMFLAVTLLNPRLISQSAPLLTALVWTLVTIALFFQYERPDRLGPVMLISAALTLCAMFCYPAMFYIPIVLVGTMQMRTFSFRSLCAVLVGIAVPLWLAYAFGWIDFATLRFSFALPTVQQLTASHTLPTLLMAALTALIGTILGFGNILTLMSYRQELRAYNGYLNITALATILFMALDLVNISAYMPILNMLMAVQAAHFFTIHKFPKLYIALFLLIAVQVLLFIAEVLRLV